MTALRYQRGSLGNAGVGGRAAEGIGFDVAFGLIRVVVMFIGARASSPADAYSWLKRARTPALRLHEVLKVMLRSRSLPHGEYVNRQRSGIQSNDLVMPLPAIPSVREEVMHLERLIRGQTHRRQIKIDVAPLRVIR